MWHIVLSKLAERRIAPHINPCVKFSPVGLTQVRPAAVFTFIWEALYKLYQSLYSFPVIPHLYGVGYPLNFSKCLGQNILKCQKSEDKVRYSTLDIKQPHYWQWTDVLVIGYSSYLKLLMATVYPVFGLVNHTFKIFWYSFFGVDKPLRWTFIDIAKP